MSKLVVLRIIKIDVEMFKLRPHSSFLMHAALMPMVSNTRATIYVGTSIGSTKCFQMSIYIKLAPFLCHLSRAASTQ
jgi:hypothetical protein